MASKCRCVRCWIESLPAAEAAVVNESALQDKGRIVVVVEPGKEKGAVEPVASPTRSLKDRRRDTHRSFKG